ncbi:MAG TPA: M1 family metallopeptidase [Acidimicrobiales bacterium]|jgi:puromycin-sensitive aminopeptidase|nr:M1 family metallopeptidase [Acidimicrobiales bacterium]
MTNERGNEADYRLPRVALPERYDIRIAPDIETGSFTGRVTIEIQVGDTVSELVLNAAELEVERAQLKAAGAGDGTALAVRLDEKLERVHLSAAEPIAAGPYTLDCSFRGQLSEKLRGFYRSTFTDPDGAEQTLATTHFESHDARRAFPCFDEPDMKAVFGIELEVAEDLFAVSNEAITATELIGNGRKLVKFADTIKMSTYLVCFVVGPLEASEPAYAGPTPVRVVTPIGKQHLAPFALDVAVHALKWFTEYFDLPYPASKLDLVDIPDFAQGAMENLGCVTFRETDLLCDPETSSIPELTRIAEVIEHELAHMWFGDLVTMKWWNGIWLNEAFATFMSILCLDDYKPEWRRWVTFGREKDFALAVDALHSTRPIEFDVVAPEEAEAMFDVLTYLKGGNVLRMLEQYLGRERFRDGVRAYLKKHQYGNTETTDLWDAIESVAGGEPVRALMDSWIFQGGVPLVTAKREDGEIVLTQEPFSWLPLAEHEAEPEAEPSAIGQDWIVPIRIAARPTDTTPDQDGGPGPITARLLGPAPNGDDPLRVGVGDGLSVVNAGGSGTYRLRYQGPLFDEIAANLDSLTALERYNLVSDTWAATLAGVSALDDFLSLARRLKGEPDPNVWGVVTTAIGMLELAVSPAEMPKLEEFVRELFGPELERIGFDAQPDEIPEIPRARSAFITVLGTIGADDEVRTKALAAYRASVEGTEALPADTAEAILQVASWCGDAETFASMRLHVEHPVDPLDQWRHLLAMSFTRQPELVEELLSMSLSEIRSQDAPYVIRVLLGNKASGKITWDFITEHWDELREKFATHAVPTMVGGIQRLADVDANGDAVMANAARAFLSEHNLGGHQRTVDQHLERLAVNVGFVREQRPSLGANLGKF